MSPYNKIRGKIGRKFKLIVPYDDLVQIALENNEVDLNYVLDNNGERFSTTIIAKSGFCRAIVPGFSYNPKYDFEHRDVGTIRVRRNTLDRIIEKAGELSQKGVKTVKFSKRPISEARKELEDYEKALKAINDYELYKN